jgi:hypothetical protein
VERRGRRAPHLATHQEVHPFGAQVAWLLPHTGRGSAFPAMRPTPVPVTLSVETEPSVGRVAPRQLRERRLERAHTASPASLPSVPSWPPCVPPFPPRFVAHHRRCRPRPHCRSSPPPPYVCTTDTLSQRRHPHLSLSSRASERAARAMLSRCASLPHATHRSRPCGEARTTSNTSQRERPHNSQSLEEDAFRGAAIRRRRRRTRTTDHRR